MTIYFTASTAGRRKKKKQYEKIIEILKKMGHNVETSFTPNEVWEKRKPRDPQKVYRETKEGIDKADAIIVEMTNPSFGVGYRLNYALAHNKYALVLYPQGLGVLAKSPLWEGNPSEFLTKKSYSMKNVNEILKNYFDGIGGKTNIKINFIVSPQLDQYLKWVVFHKKTSKSDFIRNLIQEAMSNDIEYQGFIEKTMGI